MGLTNETSRFECRFLRADQFRAIHKTFIGGFSDYIIKFELTERQFQNHITLNAVDLTDRPDVLKAKSRSACRSTDSARGKESRRSMTPGRPCCRNIVVGVSADRCSTG
jgi:hypothetical protein